MEDAILGEISVFKELEKVGNALGLRTLLDAKQFAAPGVVRDVCELYSGGQRGVKVTCTLCSATFFAADPRPTVAVPGAARWPLGRVGIHAITHDRIEARVRVDGRGKHCATVHVCGVKCGRLYSSEGDVADTLPCEHPGGYFDRCQALAGLDMHPGAFNDVVAALSRAFSV